MSNTLSATFHTLANPAFNLVRFALCTLRDKAAQRRLALRSAS
jgi:hypothetical protein